MVGNWINGDVPLENTSLPTLAAVELPVHAGLEALDKIPAQGVPTAAVALAHISPDVDPTIRAAERSSGITPVRNFTERWRSRMALDATLAANTCEEPMWELVMPPSSAIFDAAMAALAITLMLRIPIWFPLP